MNDQFSTASIGGTVIVVVAAMIGACNGDPGDSPAESSAPLSIDVVIGNDFFSETRVRVVVQEVDRPCQCHEVGAWPLDQACEPVYSNFARCECDPAPGACIERVEIHDGVGLVASPQSEERYVGHFALGPVSLADGLSLTVEGCEGVAEIDLPLALPQAPPLTEFTTDGVAGRVHWTETMPISDSLVAFGGYVCSAITDAGMSEFILPVHGGHELALLVAEGSSHNTPLGEVRVWTIGSSSTANPPEWPRSVVFPRSLNDGWWSLTPLDQWDSSSALEVSIDGADDVALMPYIGSAKMFLAPDETLMQIQVQDAYPSGEILLSQALEMDTVYLHWGVEDYYGAIPHQLPVTPMTFGTLAGTQWEIQGGPIPIPLLLDPSATAEVSFRVSADFGIVARVE